MNPEIDKEKLEELAREIWQSAKERNRNDKEDAGMELAREKAKIELVKRLERELTDRWI